ncbi:uncharacterized protein LOC120088917 [Benincasa hispida]|uniref:uncharacterized protein LOC120088917 n=1 Tax=Benincasa hispida TaxID=102211 RepID=UPI001900FBAB|nr:uncharacterized protein LOC120088917 [Benincasa hispida]
MHECTALFQNNIPEKLKDSGSFTLPCSTRGKEVGHALCDLGASNNLISLSIFKKLGIGEARPTTVTLQVVDRSITHPEGKIEDVLLQVDKFIFSADFIILDYEADMDIPIILGRPFLATRCTLINVQKRELTVRVDDQKVKFNMFNALKYLDHIEICQYIDDLRIEHWDAMRKKLDEEEVENDAIMEEICMLVKAYLGLESLNLLE